MSLLKIYEASLPINISVKIILMKNFKKLLFGSLLLQLAQIINFRSPILFLTQISNKNFYTHTYFSRSVIPKQTP